MHIRVVDAGQGYVDQRVAAARCGLGHVFQPEHVRPAEFSHHDRAHDSPSGSPVRCPHRVGTTANCPRSPDHFAPTLRGSDPVAPLPARISRPLSRVARKRHGGFRPLRRFAAYLPIGIPGVAASCLSLKPGCRM